MSKGQLTFDVEGNDIQDHIYFSRAPHIPHQSDGTVIGNSGITIGRGLDLVEEGYELAIRIGELPDSSLQAKRLTQIRHVLCASPDYLAKNGTPHDLAQLRQHSILQYGLGKQSKFDLIDATGERHSIFFSSKMQSNNGDFLLKMAIKGHGITYLPSFLAYKALAQGHLVPILCQYQLHSAYAYAVYPKNRFLSQKSFFIPTLPLLDRLYC